MKEETHVLGITSGPFTFIDKTKSVKNTLLSVPIKVLRILEREHILGEYQ